jgi:hypothetical protein
VPIVSGFVAAIVRHFQTEGAALWSLAAGRLDLDDVCPGGHCTVRNDGADARRLDLVLGQGDW